MRGLLETEMLCLWARANRQCDKSFVFISCFRPSGFLCRSSVRCATEKKEETNCETMIHFREFPLERRSTSYRSSGTAGGTQSHSDPAYPNEGPRLHFNLISADIPRHLVIARRTLLHSLNLADDGRNIFRCKDVE